jgi:PA domain-containing protein
VRIFDNSTLKYWFQMTDDERAASASNPRNVVFDGPSVNAAVPGVLAPGTPHLSITAPAAIAGVYQVGTASFGPPLSSTGVTGQIVEALDAADAAGPTTSDACSGITNAAAVSGRIALVDRGTCGYIVKVKNAQNAGAVAVIVADILEEAPPAGLGGEDPTITIPSVRITLADGNAIKTQLEAAVTATLGVNLAILAGADAHNFALLYTPTPVQAGASISHWDASAFPNQLMEASFNGDLTHSVTPPQDLTLPILRDLGWFPDADLDGLADALDGCPSSDRSATVAIGDENTGVANSMLTSGCTISDLVAGEATGARNHGAFVSGVAHLTNALKDAGIITGPDKDRIRRAAAHAK